MSAWPIKWVLTSGTLTDDKQSIPLPLSRPTSAGDSFRDLVVRVRNVLRNIVCILVDLLHSRLLLVDKLRHFLVQAAKLHHILLDLANGGRSLQSGLPGVVGLSSPATSNLTETLAWTF